MEKFKGTTKELKGPEYDVTTEPLDHALVMISGEGKKHGKEAIAGGMFPSSSRSSLPEYKARLDAIAMPYFASPTGGGEASGGGGEGRGEVTG